MMGASDVIDVTGALERAGVACWLDGGWGVDALLGAEHRDHDDLDVVVPLDSMPRVLDALGQHGYHVAEDHLPTRLVLRDVQSRQVDLHPITFDDAGDGWQAAAMPNGEDCRYPASGFATGRVGDAVVGCLAADVQLAHHTGYPPRPHDRADMARLAERFGLELPPPYDVDPSGA